MRPDDTQSDAEAALRDAAWLQSVARALVGTESDAADLAQDVQVAALTGGPPAERAPRRAWLRTVARRLAARRARRDARRREGERARADVLRGGAAGSPAADAIAARLALQRRLADALERIPLADRELLVRRHFDGASAPEIAAELGLSPAAARQRLVRATDRLRAEFARTDEEWRAWSPALALAAFGPAGLREVLAASASSAGDGISRTPDATPRAPITVRTIAPLPPALSLAAMKKLALSTLAALALAAAAWLLTRSPDGPVRDSDGREARVALASLDQDGAESGIDPGRSALEAPRRAADVQSEQGGTIVVLDEERQPVPGLCGVWITDTTGETLELEFDAEGRAPRPDAESGRILVVGAKHRFRDVDVGSRDEPRSAILLPAAPTVRGLLSVDGSLPMSAHVLRVRESFTSSGGFLRGSARPDLVWDFLAGAPDDSPAVRPDESGEFEVVVRGASASLVVSDSVRITRAQIDGRTLEVDDAVDYWRQRVPVPSSAQRVVLTGVQPAGLQVRFVESEGGTPYVGEVDVEYVSMFGPSGRTSVFSHPRDGSAFVAVPELESMDWENDRSILAFYFKVPDRFGSGAFAQRHFRSAVAMGRGLGTIEIPATESVSIRVLQRDGAAVRPAVNARVFAGLGVIPCDDQGRATIIWPEPSVAYVAADGCAMRAVRRPEPIAGEVEVTLRPSPSLVVAPVSERIEDDLYCEVRFPEHEHRPRMVGSMYQLLESGTDVPFAAQTSDRVIYTVRRLVPSRTLRYSGLPTGGPVEMNIRDRSGFVLHHERFMLTEPTEYEVEVQLDRKDLCELEVDIVSAGETAVAPTTVEVVLERPGADPRDTPSLDRDDTRTIGPLAAGEVQVNVLERSGSKERRGSSTVVLKPGSNRVQVVLDDVD